MKWEIGRQGTGYFKKLLVQLVIGSFGFDCYLLKYPEGARIPSHTDPVDGKHHWRLNIELQQAVGGKFYRRSSDPRHFIYIPKGKIHFFRPDRSPHGVTLVLDGTRYVLSFGVAI